MEQYADLVGQIVEIKEVATTRVAKLVETTPSGLVVQDLPTRVRYFVSGDDVIDVCEI